MKYNREWLDGVHDTWQLIRSAPIDVVPFHHRALIKQQFDLNVGIFKEELARGTAFGKTQAHIADLVSLMYQLIDEQKQQDAKFANQHTGLGMGPAWPQDR